MLRFTGVGLRYGAPARGSGPGFAGGAAPETLRDLTFTLSEGSFTWLLGPSGAGKTSVLRLMQCVLRPTRGEVEVLGVAVSRARRRDLALLRRRIGAVHQDFRLLPHLSAFDNVALPLRLAGRSESVLRAEVAELLAWVGLAGKQHALPAELSGGEQQRVAIARAVIARPALLVADEPTGNLDAAQARRLLALLIELNRIGTTVVVATHNEELLLRHPAPVLRLEAGRLVGAAGAEPRPAEAPGGEPGRDAPAPAPAGAPPDDARAPAARVSGFRHAGA
ncbi:cell division ATP-binding protein FtsE [Caldovatus aquaticus]|uniref:ATP-binding cassette domain-containing protein n=1 Tax=Caldovatus aquaticus TaxID=2865671 RepID=A0ABS7F3D1_9PROT|nr:ATP-binding cassette domain-containing protein [Caldovatus aquaticus]MBW8270123.1 ATP-binding cassette domain-containing protein [Caldovatus aquaticus]